MNFDHPINTSSNRRYKTIDLFAGAGGLSCGFEETGKFDIVIAVEKKDSARKTYALNHPNTEMLEDVRTLDYKAINDVYGNIDVIIGGPPCQGFSNANRQKNSVISDNNVLVKSYVKSVTELKPKAFVMENVAMLRSSTHRFFYSYDDKDFVDSLEIPLTTSELILLPEEMSLESHDAVRIITDSELLSQCRWDEKIYQSINAIFKMGTASRDKLVERCHKHKNLLVKFFDYVCSKRSVIPKRVQIWNEMAALALKNALDLPDSISLESLKKQLHDAITFQRFLQSLQKLNEYKVITEYSYNHGVTATVKSYAVFDYVTKVLGKNYVIAHGILDAQNFGAPQHRQRYIIMGIRNDVCPFSFSLPTGIDEFIKTPTTVHDAIGDLEDIEPTNSMESDEAKDGIHFEYCRTGNLLDELRDSGTIYNHINTATRENALKRFEYLSQGENFHALPENLRTTYSNAERTQNTIYLRLAYDKPCGTVINVRKSMWIHPTKARALSIREAARLQTFHDSYRFWGTKDSQYQQVGNAVPPLLAKGIANELYEVLHVMDYNSTL